MLREHLSQAHDAASRRSAIIEAHIEWIQREVLQTDRAACSIWAAAPVCTAAISSTRPHVRGHRLFTRLSRVWA
jgi:hypothetical protein